MHCLSAIQLSSVLEWRTWSLRRAYRMSITGAHSAQDPLPHFLCNRRHTLFRIILTRTLMRIRTPTRTLLILMALILPTLLHLIPTRRFLINLRIPI
jgi:hypothetical protein